MGPLVYAATLRCPCGAGMAYPKNGDYPGGEPDGPLRWPYSGYWECSAILLGTADASVKHEAQLPFAFYEVKDEGQPSARGATTRPDA